MKTKTFAIVGLVAGTLLALTGGEAPAIIRNFECLFLMAAALGLGFAARNPSMPDWLRSDAVLGTALVYIGVGAAFVPPNLLIASVCIGTGLRLVCRSAVNVTVSQSNRDIVLRERSTAVETRR